MLKQFRNEYAICVVFQVFGTITPEAPNVLGKRQKYDLSHLNTAGLQNVVKN